MREANQQAARTSIPRIRQSPYYPRDRSSNVIIRIKIFTNNEWFFPVHFKGHPNVPGVLMLEAMAQMLTVAITTLPGNKGKVTHAISHEVKFKKEIHPGQKLIIESKVISWKRGLCNGLAKGFVNKDLVCEANMVITIPQILSKYFPKTT